MNSLSRYTVSISRLKTLCSDDDFIATKEELGDRMDRKKLSTFRIYFSWLQESDNSSSEDEIPERDVTYHLICLLIYH